MVEENAAESTDAQGNGTSEQSAENEVKQEKASEEGKEQASEQTAEEKKAAEEHHESSQLGRKVSDISKTLNSFMERTEELLVKQNEPVNENNVVIGDDDFVDGRTVKKMFVDYENEKTAKQTEYGQTYTKTLGNIESDATDAEHEEAVKLTLKHEQFNIRSNADPSAAAEINYLKALNYVRKGGDKKFKGDRYTPPAGDSSSTKKGAEVDVMAGLNDEAKEYIRVRNLSPEQVKELLSDKEPIFAQNLELMNE